MSDEKVILTAKEKNMVILEIAPWKRYCARSLDMCSFAMPLGIFLAIYFPEALKLPSLYIELIFGLTVIPIWLLVESMLLSIFGTTLGKWFFNIYIKDSKNRKITYLMALKRTCLVFSKGFAFSVPIVSLITCMMAYVNLTSTGTTSWDRDCSLTVTRGDFGIIRLITIILLMLIFIFLFILGTMN